MLSFAFDFALLLSDKIGTDVCQMFTLCARAIRHFRHIWPKNAQNFTSTSNQTSQSLIRDTTAAIFAPPNTIRDTVAAIFARPNSIRDTLHQQPILGHSRAAL